MQCVHLFSVDIVCFSYAQLQRLTELEDFAAEQQNTISALSGMLKEREDDVVNLTQQMKVYEKEMKDEQKRLVWL